MNLNLLFIIFFTHHVLCISTNTFEYECENYEKDEQALQSAYKMRYEFRMTSNKGRWDNVKAQCSDMGGQLISHNLRDEGLQYHEFFFFLAATYVFVFQRVFKTN